MTLFVNFPVQHPFWAHSILITFYFEFIPFWAHSILSIFHFEHIPIWTHSEQSTFHFEHIPVWADAILSTFLIEHIPFWALSFWSTFHFLVQLEKNFGSNVLVEGGYGCCLNKKARRVADQIFWTTRTIYVYVVFFIAVTDRAENLDLLSQQLKKADVTEQG